MRPWGRRNRNVLLQSLRENQKPYARESNVRISAARAHSCSWMSPQCDQFSSSHDDDANHKWKERDQNESLTAHIDLDSPGLLVWRRGKEHKIMIMKWRRPSSRWFCTLRLSKQQQKLIIWLNHWVIGRFMFLWTAASCASDKNILFNFENCHIL